jgi:hypothetical protein
MLGMGAVLDKTQEGMRGDRERLEGARCEVNEILGHHTNSYQTPCVIKIFGGNAIELLKVYQGIHHRESKSE